MSVLGALKNTGEATALMRRWRNFGRYENGIVYARFASEMTINFDSTGKRSAEHKASRRHDLSEKYQQGSSSMNS